MCEGTGIRDMAALNFLRSASSLSQISAHVPANNTCDDLYKSSNRNDNGMTIRDYSNRNESQNTLNIAKGLHSMSTSDVMSTTSVPRCGYIQKSRRNGSKKACQVDYSTDSV